MQNGWLSLTDGVAPKRRNTQRVIVFCGTLFNSMGDIAGSNMGNTIYYFIYKNKGCLYSYDSSFSREFIWQRS